jgi:UDP-glucose 4-epimerase
MKIIVTGATGFIGKNLLLSLNKEWDVTAIGRNVDELNRIVSDNQLSNVKVHSCDLSSEGAVEELFGLIGGKFDVCVYLAGNTDPNFSVQNPKEDMLANSGAVVNFLSRIEVGKFIYFSSGAVYHGLEGEVNPEVTLDPKLPYAISKLASEQYVQFFQKKGNVGNYLIVRFFGAYGPYEPPRKITTKLIKELLFEGEDYYEIYGDGENIIDIMFVDDTVDCIINMINDEKIKNVTFDLCTGRQISINNFVMEVAKILGKEDIRIISKGVSNENIMFRASKDNCEKYFNFKERVSLDKGLGKLIQHLKKT